MTTPPDNLPTYRLLTGPDDAAFCKRVSEALALGPVSAIFGVAKALAGVPI